jgi:hypothetical protein
MGMEQWLYKPVNEVWIVGQLVDSTYELMGSFDTREKAGEFMVGKSDMIIDGYNLEPFYSIGY